MARIRTIKPEFWTSEAIAAMPIRTRLTFIGTWSYVDDNGVGLDSDKLITAALYPLEDDPREALANVREDLAILADHGRITRYTVNGKRYFAITSWDEHQRIDRPGKSRYPGPDQADTPPPSSTNTDSHVCNREDDCNPRESVATSHLPEQGTGNREQGNREQGTGDSAKAVIASGDTRSGTDLVVADPDTPTAQTLVAEWIDRCPKRPPSNVIGQVGKQVAAMLAEPIDPNDVRRGLAAWMSKGLHPSALPSVVNEVMNAPVNGRKRSTTDERVAAGLDLVAKYRALEGAA